MAPEVNTLPGNRQQVQEAHREDARVVGKQEETGREEAGDVFQFRCEIYHIIDQPGVEHLRHQFEKAQEKEKPAVNL